MERSIDLHETVVTAHSSIMTLQDHWPELIEILPKIIERIASSGATVYIMGDFNVNMFKFPAYCRAADQVHTMISFFLPLVSTPKRCINSSINNIFTNDIAFIDHSEL